jgi:transposase
MSWVVPGACAARFGCRPQLVRPGARRKVGPSGAAVLDARACHMPRFLHPDRRLRVQVDAELDATLGEDHLARFIWTALEGIDLSVLEARYRSRADGPGRSAIHPRLLAALWIYGLGQGMETAAEIARACTLRDDFRWLAGGVHVSDQTLLNFLQASPDGFAQLWQQLLQALQRNAPLDLSAVFEDGSKVRANASPSSFVTEAKLQKTVSDLEERLAVAKAAAAAGDPSPEQRRRHNRVLHALQGRLDRARAAHSELRARGDRRAEREKDRAHLHLRVVQPVDAEPGGVADARGGRLYGASAFRHDVERNVLICPQGECLTFIGEYRDNARDPSSPHYKLYGRRNCTDCPQRAQCTNGRSRRVKIRVRRTERAENVTPPPAPAIEVAEAEVAAPTASATAPKATDGPRASLTDPEAVMMLATSEKRFEPCFNADITVTPDGIIVSQFLTKNPTDYPNFAIALRAVEDAVGKPQRWVGDGHYGSRSNLALAKSAGILLYAPPAGESNDNDEASTSISFRHDVNENVLICAQGEKLRHLGSYADDRGDGYDLYGRSDCGECSRRADCTKSKGPGRRRKLYPPTSLLGELRQRLADDGGALKRRRSGTVEPVHAQLKAHGLGRLHVRGLKRCAAALTLAAAAHNLRKWHAKRVLCPVVAAA